MSNDEMIQRAQELVQQVTEARFEGGLYSKLARAHGYADGYMRALLDAGIVDHKTLLAAVSEARRDAVAADDARAAAA